MSGGSAAEKYFDLNKNIFVFFVLIKLKIMSQIATSIFPGK